MRNLISKSVKVFTVTALSAVLWVGTSHAASILKVEDVTNGVTTTVTDNGMCDSVETKTMTGLNNSMIVTANANIVTSTGTSKPLSGNSNTVDLMDLLNLETTRRELFFFGKEVLLNLFFRTIFRVNMEISIENQSINNEKTEIRRCLKQFTKNQI